MFDGFTFTDKFSSPNARGKTSGNARVRWGHNLK